MLKIGWTLVEWDDQKKIMFSVFDIFYVPCVLCVMIPVYLWSNNSFVMECTLYPFLACRNETLTFGPDIYWQLWYSKNILSASWPIDLSTWWVGSQKIFCSFRTIHINFDLFTTGELDSNNVVASWYVCVPTPTNSVPMDFWFVCYEMYRPFMLFLPVSIKPWPIDLMDR
jgi:hypothetical protein